MAAARIAVDEQVSPAVTAYVAHGHRLERLGFAADHRPHSSSANRFTAEAFGFLLLTQSWLAPLVVLQCPLAWDHCGAPSGGISMTREENHASLLCWRVYGRSIDLRLDDHKLLCPAKVARGTARGSVDDSFGLHQTARWHSCVGG